MMRVLIMREEHMWVAQCLEHDIAAQGASLPEVKQAFAIAFAAQIAVALHYGQDPRDFLGEFGRAPEFYWEKFSQAERLAEPIRVPDRVEIPPAFMLNAMQTSLADGWIAS